MLRLVRRPHVGEIATELSISARTAEPHVQNIYTKISVSNRVAATRWAVTHRVVDGRPQGRLKLDRSSAPLWRGDDHKFAGEEQ